MAVRQWQTLWVENPSLGAQCIQKPLCLEGQQPTERPFAQGAVEQQDSRRMSRRANPREISVVGAPKQGRLNVREIRKQV
jgi:hypothetical protein